MPSSRRIQDIERLRALAALAVLIGHVPWLQVGISRLLHIPFDPWTGVDLFFVISGFVVSSAFERDLTQSSAGGSAIRAFYRKRAARILPTAYLGLALWWIGVTWLNRSGTWGAPLHGSDAAGMVISGLLLVSNYAGAFFGVTMPLYWFWSICVEEHLYLLYPAFRVTVTDFPRRAAAVACVIVAVHAVRLLVDDPHLRGGLSHLRFDQLALGVLIGLVHTRWAAGVAAARELLRQHGRWRNAATITLLVLLVLLGLLATTLLKDMRAPDAELGYALAGVLSAAIVALASCDADLLAFAPTPIGAWLSSIGARSYGIYMFHVPALWIVVELRFRIFAQTNAAWLRAPELAAYVTVLWLMVAANYRWIERPLIAWASRPRC